MLIIVPRIAPANVKIILMLGQKIDVVYDSTTTNNLQNINLKTLKHVNSSYSANDLFPL